MPLDMTLLRFQYVKVQFSYKDIFKANVGFYVWEQNPPSVRLPSPDPCKIKNGQPTIVYNKMSQDKIK